MQKARETGDPSYYARADRSFDAALRRDPRDLTAVLGAGTLAGLRHDFSEQLGLGLEAQRIQPGLVDAYPVIADAQIELGRYGAAENTIQRMLDAKPNLASYARASYFRELNGDLDGALDAMGLAVSAGAGVPENVAYVQNLIGDLELQRGRPAAARIGLSSGAGASAALCARPGRARARGYRHRRPRECSSPAPGSDPAAAAHELSDPARGHRCRARRRRPRRGDLDVVRAQQRLLGAAGTRPDAELILFEASHGDPAAAVRLGRKLWAQAPSVRSADALGWALTRAGRPGEGLAWAQRALRLGSRDALFHLHAGLAAQAAGRAGLAAAELRTALAGGAALSALQARDARQALEVVR